jgi:Zn ribbon nucleic-acid-binding protein
MFWSKPKLISFDHGQKVLVTVLRDVSCNDWADRVVAVPASSFPSLLGGMGSFSDLVICRENHHEVTADREPLANELVDCLRSICYSSSKMGALTADAAIASCGTVSLVLTGWRCLACGHAQVTSRGVRSLIAAATVRRAIRDGILRRTPSETLLGLWQAPEDSNTIRLFIEQARTSGIQYSDSDSWMRPCPACSSEDTCLYRWREDDGKFVPTDDNLPLRRH